MNQADQIDLGIDETAIGEICGKQLGNLVEKLRLQKSDSLSEMLRGEGI